MNKKMKLSKNKKKSTVDAHKIDKSIESTGHSEEVYSLIDDYDVTSRMDKTPLRVVVADMLIDLPPSALENIGLGVKNFLNGVCMHEIEQFEGLVLSYGKIEFCDNAGIIFEDSPYAHVFIRTEFLIYNASAGYKLFGRVTNQSLSHIHLHLHDQFYVKIPRHFIPLDVFLWKDNDEFYDAMFLNKQLNLDRMYAEGQWVFSDTGAIIEEDSWLEFEVMGADTNNGQLYIIGSLLHYSKSNYDQEKAFEN
ncbi:hypothetical protein C1645_201999 [Glomus cerebriforme]|uniref:RPA43 OB domain-containing protein n=1 Tax=Glomus cerebriforme TaxID=658196 RepID=A0A397ST96_9GLOM|nr:hypothetical protein C1645_201999 [Glomus cerebriforme]